MDRITQDKVDMLSKIQALLRFLAHEHPVAALLLDDPVHIGPLQALGETSGLLEIIVEMGRDENLSLLGGYVDNRLMIVIANVS